MQIIRSSGLGPAQLASSLCGAAAFGGGGGGGRENKTKSPDNHASCLELRAPVTSLAGALLTKRANELPALIGRQAGGQTTAAGLMSDTDAGWRAGRGRALVTLSAVPNQSVNLVVRPIDFGRAKSTCRKPMARASETSGKKTRSSTEICALAAATAGECTL